ncbi:hypothetical protein L1887_48099 [Cichorium endivia]|nr:hypothetical protein L1887_48099 [Cichorium endivia]
MLTLEPFSEDQGRSAVHPARGIPPISFLAPCGFTHPLTRTHVRLLGPCFKTGRMGCPQAGAGSTQVYRRDGACCQPRSTRRHLHEPIDSSGFGRRTNPHRSTPRVDRRTGYRRSTSDRDASPAPIRFPPDNFKHSLTLFSKGLGPGPPLRTLLQTTIRTARPSDFQAGLIPVRSPLLRESLASLTAHDARHNTRVFSTTTSRASTEGDSSLGQPHHKHGRPISAPMPCVPIRDAWLGATRCVTPRQACLGRMALGATCVQKLDGSRDSAIHTMYRILLRSSSMREPRYPLPRSRFDNDPSAGSPTETLLRLLLPLNDKVQWNSRDVAGGEPPTSPRS